MEIKRIALMVLLAAGIVVPVAFAQLSSAVVGPDFGFPGLGGETQVAALDH
ncbi:hypothetical protein [Muricoccus radiodurans]|uniref:hypothetical protein n=1 Tax=Muricoccus radiodurans TaxID=2231721 RepID=UPI003CFA621A